MEEVKSYDLGYSLSINKVPQMLAAHGRNELPVMLLGRTGIGKTRVVESFGQEHNRPVTTIMGSQIEPTDPQGIPFPDFEKQVARYLPHSVFAKLRENSILFLDEVNRARPEVQNALFRVILDRVAGELDLPRGVMIVSAANPPTRPNMVYPLAAPLRDRFQIVPVHSDADGWTEWAVSANIHPLIVAYIKHRPDHLSPELPNDTSDMRGWPSPRSWESVSNTMHALVGAQKVWSRQANDSKSEIFRVKLLGTVGPAAGQDFLQFQAIGSKLPDPKLVLDGKIKFPSVAENASIIYATSVSVTQELIGRVRNAGNRGGKIMEDVFSVMSNPHNGWPAEIIAVMSTAIANSRTAVDAFTDFASSDAANKLGLWDTEHWKIFQRAVNTRI